MTLKNILKNVGNSNAGDKVFDRYHHGSSQNQGYYGGGYNFHQPPPNYHNPHVYKHFSQHTSTNTGSKGGGSGAAMSALTLLSFLFFLNILQQCLKDHMMAMNPQVTVMTAGREEPNPQLDTLNSKQGKTDMVFIQQPKDNSYGIGRAYPMDITEDYNDFKSYPKNISINNYEIDDEKNLF